MPDSKNTVPVSQSLGDSDVSLSTPKSPISKAGEHAVIDEIRTTLSELFTKLGKPKGSCMPNGWYFALLAIDPEFVTQNYQTDTYHCLSNPGTPHLNGFEYVFSTAFSDQQIIEFAKLVLKDAKRSNAPAELIKKELIGLLGDCRRYEPLKTLTALLKIPKADTASLSLCSLLFNVENNDSDIAGVNRLFPPSTPKQREQAARRKIISRAWELLDRKGAFSLDGAKRLEHLKNEIRCFSHFADIGLPDERVTKRLAHQFEKLQYLTPLNTTIDMEHEFGLFARCHHVSPNVRLKLQQDQRLISALEQEGIVTAPIIDELLFELFQEIWLSNHPHWHKSWDQSVYSFPSQYDRFYRSILDTVESKGCAAIDRERVAQIFDDVGITQDAPKSYLFKECASFFSSEPQTVLRDIFDWGSDSSYTELYLSCFSAQKLSQMLEIKHFLSFSFPSSSLSSELLRECGNALREACTDVARSIDGFFRDYNPTNFIEVVRRLPIDSKLKRILTMSAVLNSVEDHGLLGTDIAYFEHFKMFRAFLDVLYSPLSEYRGGLKSLHEREGSLSPLGPAFSVVMNDLIPFNTVQPEDERAMLSKLSALFIECIETGYFGATDDGTVQKSHIKSLKRNETSRDYRRSGRSVSPLSTVPQVEEVIGEVSQPLGPLNRYLLTSVCNTYSRRSMRYGALGVSVERINDDCLLTQFIAQELKGGSFEKEVAVSIREPRERSMLPLAITSLGQSIEILGTDKRVEIETELDGVPYIRRDLRGENRDLTYLIQTQETIAINDQLTIRDYRMALPEAVRKATSRRGVATEDLAPAVVDWIKSVDHSERLFDAIDRLQRVIGDTYLYNLLVADNPSYQHIISKLRATEPRRDPYLAAIHATAREQYLGQTVCGGAAHVMIQALRHAGIASLMGAGFRLKQGARTFTTMEQHTFPMLLLKQSNSFMLYPIESTKYMDVAPESYLHLANIQRERGFSSMVNSVLDSVTDSTEMRREFPPRTPLNEAEVIDLTKRLTRILTRKGRSPHFEQSADPETNLFRAIDELYSVEGIIALNQLSRHRSLTARQRLFVDSVQKDMMSTQQEILGNLDFSTLRGE